MHGAMILGRQTGVNKKALNDKVHECMLSRFCRVQLCVTPWTVAHQAPLSVGFSKQEYWSGLPCPPPGDLPNPGIEPATLTSLHWQAGSLPLAPPGKKCLLSALGGTQSKSGKLVSGSSSSKQG